MWKFLFENFWWKVSALVLAVALWFTLILEPDLVTSASVPIFFKNLPKGLEFASEAPDRIVLEIRGPASKLSPDALKDTAVQVDLSAVARSGERSFTLDRSNIMLPFGVTFVRAVPSQLQMTFDRQLTKEVEVKVRYDEKPPEGIRIAAERIEPMSLRIVGPATKVESLQFALTDPIDIDWTPGEKSARVHVFAGDPQVRFESMPMVTVRTLVERAPR
jgi:YbbR domain-containing protein